MSDSKNNYGIDYGMNQSNIDTSTGIRYGVIPTNALSDWALENFESDYGEPTCSNCGNSIVEYDDEKHGEYEGRGCSNYACETCHRYMDSSEVYGEDLIGYSLDDGEYEAEMSSEGIDVFITKSPYYTYAEFCSPCAPGACYLLNSVDSNGPKCYCFGPEWFEDNTAPYPVYRVADGSLVNV